jgi:hypothetical protein
MGGWLRSQVRSRTDVPPRPSRRSPHPPVTVVQVYRNLPRRCWSVGWDSRVIAHERQVVLCSCILRVRESGRRCATRDRQRNVHAWIEGVICKVAAGELVEIGCNPFLAPTFTIRPDFDPVHEAQYVVLSPNGRAYAVLRSPSLPAVGQAPPGQQETGRPVHDEV